MPTKRVPPAGPGDLHLVTHKFNGIRLTLAREVRSLTRVELADRVGKTPSAISQFEGGRSRPDARTVAALALALGVPFGFFARASDRVLSLDSCHFRTLRSASQRERRKLLAIGTLMCEVVETLDEYVELPVEAVSSVARAVSSASEIESAAAEVRRAWGLGLGPIPNVVKLLQSRGSIVCVVPATCVAVDAFSAWHNGRPIIFLVADRRGTRVRFDAAHELGHLVMHADVTPGSHAVEGEAHRFAGAFLLPQAPFLDEWPRWLNWDQIFELKHRWGVSAAALVRRAYDLNAISEASYRRANIHLRRQLGREEPNEVITEAPTLVERSLELIDEAGSLADVAAEHGLTIADLRALVRGELPDFGASQPSAEEGSTTATHQFELFPIGTQNKSIATDEQ